jgi:hypothetical protein
MTTMKSPDGMLAEWTATRICVECDRRFNLFDADDANEWFYGHDCEAA